MKSTIVKPFLTIVIFWLGTNQALAQACFESSVTSPTPFMGNDSEVFRLANGTIGEVVAEYEYMYEYYPSVTICPTSSMMIVDGKRLNIRILATAATAPGASTSTQTTTSQPSVIESKIDDEFEGYEMGNIYKLRNGQLWEQISARYRYRYKYAPDVIIVNRGGTYQMQVEGMEDWVRVMRLN